jgi:hypothetical protein
MQINFEGKTTDEELKPTRETEMFIGHVIGFR